MELEIKVDSRDLTDEEVQEATYDIHRTLGEEHGLSSTVPQQEPRPGAKGEGLTIGVLVVTLLTSKAALALIGVLKAHLSRSKRVRIMIRSKAGETIIDADDLRSKDPKALAAIVAAASQQ